MKKNIVLIALFIILGITYGQLQGQVKTSSPNARLRALKGVRHIADLAYVENNHDRQSLDLLLPEKASDKSLPLVVFVHGGAWQGGDKSIGLRLMARFVATGEYAAATIGYRLSGDAIWPAQIHDCKAAIRWLRANADKYGYDGDRIGVWGRSAGGHLVAMLGTSSGVELMDGDLGENKDVSSRVSCVVDYFGPTDILKLAGPRTHRDVTDSPLTKLIGGSVWDNKEKTITANPIIYATDDDSPFLIIHGTKDPLVPHDQSVMLQDALNSVKVSCTLITVQEGGHGKGFGSETDRLVKQFFDHHLRDIKVEWEDKVIEAGK